jgi:hypothetical protein
MNGAERDRSIRIYGGLMGEAKFRIQWIEYAVNGRTGLDSRLVEEFCYLQLRMICELIALGCLALHGDIPATQTRKFQRTHAADDILDGLERLHPEFYPRPVIDMDPGPKLGRLIPRPNEDFTTKNELLDLYRKRCSPNLHKGSLTKLLSNTSTVQKRFPNIVEPTQRIANLLSFHLIGLTVGETEVICVLNAPDGNVRVALAVPDDPLE